MTPLHCTISYGDLHVLALQFLVTIPICTLSLKYIQPELNGIFKSILQCSTSPRPDRGWSPHGKILSFVLGQIFWQIFWCFFWRIFWQIFCPIIFYPLRASGSEYHRSCFILYCKSIMQKKCGKTDRQKLQAGTEKPVKTKVWAQGGAGLTFLGHEVP